MSVYKVYSGLSYKYVAKKDRYWDQEGVGAIMSDTTEDVVLMPYGGLEAEFAVDNGNPVLTVANGELPSKEVFAGVRGLVAPVGDYQVNVGAWCNFDTNGEPVINEISGAVSGFSKDNFLKKVVSLGESFEMYVKFTVTSSEKNQIVVANQTTGASPIRSDSLFLKAWSSNGNGGTFVLDVNESYWAKAVSDGVTYSLYGMADTGQTLEEVKASEDWVLSWSCAASWIFGVGDNELYFGHNTTSYSSQYLEGSIELSGVEISNEDTLIWSPWGMKSVVLNGMLAEGLEDTGNETLYNLFYKDGKVVLDTVAKKDGFVWVGEKTIPKHVPITVLEAHFEIIGNVEINDYNASFGNGAYLLADEVFPAAECIDFVTQVTPQSVSGWRTIASTPVASIGTKNANWFLNDGGDVVAGTFEAGLTYWLCVRQNKTLTKLYYMLDDGTYATYDDLPDVTNAAWSAGPELNISCFPSGGYFRLGGSATNREFATLDLRKSVLRYGMWYFAPTDGIPPANYEYFWRALS